ncbi:MAG: HAD family hydrolase [Desulfobacterales bacterium]|nr:HAD family hydrolase [Desulfobacterales bacterium]
MLFFDIDNTLLDNDTAESLAAISIYNQNQQLQEFYSEDEFSNIWNETAEKLKQKYRDGKFNFQRLCQGIVKEVFKNTCNEQETETIISEYLTAYEENWQLYYDVLPMLDRYKDIPKGIISNGDKELQRHKLRKTGIDHYFSTVVISGDIEIFKPDPRIFLHAVEKAGMEPSQCWYIGDQEVTDAKAAKDSGLTGVWLNRKMAGKYEKVPEIISLNDLIYSAP